MCMCGRRSTNERKWLQCHPKDNAVCRVTTDFINIYIFAYVIRLRSVVVNTHTMSHPVVIVIIVMGLNHVVIVIIVMGLTAQSFVTEFSYKCGSVLVAFCPSPNLLPLTVLHQCLV